MANSEHTLQQFWEALCDTFPCDTPFTAKEVAYRLWEDRSIFPIGFKEPWGAHSRCCEFLRILVGRTKDLKECGRRGKAILWVLPSSPEDELAGEDVWSGGM